MAQRALHQYLQYGVDRFPDHPAIEEPGRGAITYRQLGALSTRLRDRLRLMGVRRGDRVGIYLHKSIDAVASICGILEAGAAYVPVDPIAPPSRNAYILNDCSVKVIVTETGFAERLTGELESYGAQPHL